MSFSSFYGIAVTFIEMEFMSFRHFYVIRWAPLDPASRMFGTPALHNYSVIGDDFLSID